MTIDYKFFLIALVLLWMPRQVLRLGSRPVKSKRRSQRTEEQDPRKIREPGDPSVIFSVEFSKFRNYVDFLRGLAGSVAIMGSTWGVESCLQSAGDLSRTKLLVLRSAILLVGVLIQCFRFENRFTMYAPLFFISGISVGLCGVPVAGFALVLIWTINTGLRSPTLFLTFYALLIAIFSALFLGYKSVVIYIAPVIFFLPVLISLMAQRPLVMFARKHHDSDES